MIPSPKSLEEAKRILQGIFSDDWTGHIRLQRLACEREFSRALDRAKADQMEKDIKVLENRICDAVECRMCSNIKNYIAAIRSTAKEGK